MRAPAALSLPPAVSASLLIRSAAFTAPRAAAPSPPLPLHAACPRLRPFLPPLCPHAALPLRALAFSRADHAAPLPPIAQHSGAPHRSHLRARYMPRTNARSLTQRLRLPHNTALPAASLLPSPACLPASLDSISVMGLPACLLPAPACTGKMALLLPLPAPYTSLPSAHACLLSASSSYLPLHCRPTLLCRAAHALSLLLAQRSSRSPARSCLLCCLTRLEEGLRLLRCTFLLLSCSAAQLHCARSVVLPGGAATRLRRNLPCRKPAQKNETNARRSLSRFRRRRKEGWRDQPNSLPLACTCLPSAQHYLFSALLAALLAAVYTLLPHLSLLSTSSHSTFSSALLLLALTPRPLFLPNLPAHHLPASPYTYCFCTCT